ncbi:uncharacterized protein B0H18DRAFT_983555 [Fomitopsis serialis]|uniref:uncharacterized protein n=1 Tax=Fomitopsis serialis TaxID=139415 RepID=UPI0020080183|nr:uncharacterized protein B0H18DRAFT_983555 [Neoantrodia serialis]KAH9933412.1 hypothetical protein B0H18DRAFT_983555 [Neoantrodia serialis]
MAGGATAAALCWYARVRLQYSSVTSRCIRWDDLHCRTTFMMATVLTALCTKVPVIMQGHKDDNPTYGSAASTTLNIAEVPYRLDHAPLAAMQLTQLCVPG